MVKVKDFIYNDIVLYSKGWYEHNDVIEDLGYLFSKIYAWYPKKESEIASKMLRALDVWYEKAEIPHGYCVARWYNTHLAFEEEIRHRIHFYDQSRDMAIIQLVLGIFQGLMRDEIQLTPPHYGKKEHFRMGNLFGEKYPISMTYTQMNRIANASFKE